MSEPRFDPDTTRALVVDRMRDVIVTIAVVCAAVALTLTAGLAWVCWQLNQADPDEWGGGR